MAGSVETHLLKPIQPSITIGTTGNRSASDGPICCLASSTSRSASIICCSCSVLLIVRDRWMLVKTITAFTVAHSISLAAATFAVIQVPAAPLNAAIALSILFSAGDRSRLARADQLHDPASVGGCVRVRAAARTRFASGLATLGLPRNEIPLALLLFNIGVEIGQLAFVAL